MDPLTHTATGLFLSRVGLKSWTPWATPILLLAANAPDADIVTLAGGPLSYLHYHRHLTHSLAAMPLMALLVVGVVRLAVRRPVCWWGAFAAALIAVATHLALDLTNAYGVRLLLPFSARWLRLDLTNIVDLWIWAALLLAVAAPFIGRLVSAEIASGASPERHYGRGFAIFGLAFLLFYNCGRAVLHARADAVLESRVYAGRPAARTAALPDAAAPWRWRGLAETDEFYAVSEVDLRREFDAAEAAIFHKPEPALALAAARRTPTFQEFLRFSQFPLWQVSPVAEPEDGFLVEIIDMRFGTPRDPGFMVGAIVDSRQRVLNTYFHFDRRTRR